MSNGMSNPLIRTYSFSLDERFLNKQFTEEEKQILRPIAETLSLLDGNRFFSLKLENGKEWYEQYLPDAATIFYSNGGITGRLAELSWIKEKTHENDAVRDAYVNWKTIKILSSPD